jgi:hypothetical protein
MGLPDVRSQKSLTPKATFSSTELDRKPKRMVRDALLDSTAGYRKMGILLDFLMDVRWTMKPKRVLCFLAAAFAVAAAGCQPDGAMAPREIQPSLAAASGGVEENFRIPIDLFVLVPCANGGAGEVIAMSGNLHVLFNILADGNGGFHLKSHSQPQGISGAGQVTGAKYQAVGVTQEHQNVTAGANLTYVNNFRMIGQGPGNNFQVHETFHVTINANGQLTVSHGALRVTCK